MVKRFFPLRSPDPAPGGGEGAPPPAAEIVLNSDAKEADAAEIVRLKRENEKLSKDKRDVETRVSELEDENRQLKTIPKAPEPVPAPVVKKGWLHGATFFD